MNKRLIFLVIAITLFSIQYAESATNTSFSKSRAIDWLDNRTSGVQGNQETALSLLALNSNNMDVSEKLQEFLQNNPDRNCYPRGNCKIKDTSFSILALDRLGESTENALSWLETKEHVARTQGDWLIQIFSTGSGKCTLSHEDDPEIFVFVNGTKNQLKLNNQFIDWIDIKRDLKSSLEDPLEEFEVDCSDLGGSTTISLLRRTRSSGEEFRILQQEDTNKATLNVKDICYGDAGCNKDDTFIASFILYTINKNKEDNEISAFQYLRDNAVSNLDYAILYDITQDERYSDLLLENQNEAGNWDNDIFTTSIAAYALRNSQENKVQESISWLKKKQKQDGSIGNQLETASSLYFVLTSDYSQTTKDNEGTGAYCGDNIVQKEIGEICDGTSDTKKENALEDCQGLCSSKCECTQAECRVDEDCLPRQQCNTKTLTCFSAEEKFQCSSDDDCPPRYSCDVVARTCKLLQQEGCSTDRDCNEDETCNKLSGECEKQEDICGDGICSKNEDEESCARDCSTTTTLEPQPEKKSYWWVWIFVFVLGLGVLIFIIYKKSLNPGDEPESYFEMEEKPKKKPGKPSPRKTKEESWSESPGDRHQQDALEEQIDSSLKEAQELLKKK